MRNYKHFTGDIELDLHQLGRVYQTEEQISNVLNALEPVDGRSAERYRAKLRDVQPEHNLIYLNRILKESSTTLYKLLIKDAD